MCLDLAPIAADCLPVTGGIVDALYLSYKKDVAGIPAPVGVTGAIAADITMQAGKYFQPMEFVDDNGSWKEDSTGDPGFGKLKTVISIVLKGQKAAVNWYLNNILNGAFVLIWTDAEGQAWVGGNPKKGFQLSHKKDSGTKGDDKSMVTVEFSLTSAAGAIAYNGVIPVAP